MVMCLFLSSTTHTGMHNLEKMYVIPL